MNVAPLLTAILALALGMDRCAFAQWNSDGLSTEVELAQIRRVVNVYFDAAPNAWFGGKAIDWKWTEIARADIDDRPGLEALVHIVGYGLCGASTCPNAVVRWNNGRAKVIGIIGDSSLSVLPTKTHGLHDLSGHYYDCKWDGRQYVHICRPGGVCENG